MAGGGHGTRAVIAALLANAGIAIAKFVGFALTGATSMPHRSRTYRATFGPVHSPPSGGRLCNAAYRASRGRAASIGHQIRL